MVREGTRKTPVPVSYTHLDVYKRQMVNRLKNYFPMIRERKEVLEEICSNHRLQALFQSWEKEHQEEFLDFCTGMKGVKILYDSFFKEIMNPEYTPDRLARFLSLVLGKQVRIRQVLPNDSSRIADENSLLITDILVEFDDGSLANVEIQKIGYAFPGERSACYSADLDVYKRQALTMRILSAMSPLLIRYRNTGCVYAFAEDEFETSHYLKLPEYHVTAKYLRSAAMYTGYTRCV